LSTNKVYRDAPNEIEISQKLEMIINDSKLRKTLVEKGIAKKINFKTAKLRVESYINFVR
jgi:hypothetical protein